MENQFAEVMSKRTDGELLEIISKYRNDYQTLAIEAAENEIAKRNLTPERIEIAKEAIKFKGKSEQEKADEPLDAGSKILFFIFCFGIIPWGIASTYKTNGYIRKHKEAWKFMKYGVLTFVGIYGLLLLIGF